MDQSTFEASVYAKWADRYRCTIEHLQRPGTDIMPEEDFVDSDAIHIWYIAERAFARMDPACEDLTRRALASLPEGTVLGPNHLTTEVTQRSIRRTEDNLLHYLHPQDLRPVTVLPPYTVRHLTKKDSDVLAHLQAGCAAPEAEEAEVSVEDEIGFGCFHDAEMVAIATGFRMTGFMDIGVLTHPDHRQRSLGKACVTALACWCIEHGVTPQYRCRADNTGSRRIAETLGFQLFFRECSVFFTPAQEETEQ